MLKKVDRAMSNSKVRAPPPESFLNFLLTLVALSGEFPTSLISRIPGSESYKAKAITRLKNTGWLKTCYRDGFRGLRLTQAAIRELSILYPNQYLPLLSQKNSLSAPKYDLSSRLRLHRMAEVLLTMIRSDIIVYPWEKPGVFLPDEEFALWGDITKPIYYSSFEVKGIGQQATMIRNSRATGLLFSPHRILAVYNTADGEMKWEFDSETRLKIFVQQDICLSRLSGQYASVIPSALIFASSMRQFPVLLSAKKPGQKPFVYGNQFTHFYYLTMDHHGEFLLRLLCSERQETMLRFILSSDLEPSKNYYVENDGFDEQGAPVLFAYSCDIPRIHRFLSGLEMHGLSGSIICFDFQVEALREICGKSVSILSVDFDEYEARCQQYPNLK